VRWGALERVRDQSVVPLVSRTSARYSVEARRRTGDATLLATYETVGTIFAVVHSLAVATAKVDWHLYRPAKSGIKEDRIEVTTHAALDLWRMPNKFMPRRRFLETAQQHVDLTGEADILTSSIRLGGKSIPLELWPMRPDRIQPVPDPYEFLSGYVYTAPDGEMIPLDVTECLPILMPNPRNPYRGLGPIQSILSVIASTKAAEEWDAAFFENSAEPGGIIEVPEELNDAQFDELKSRWASTHQGTSKAHRVAILEAGMKWVDRQFSQRDMQMAELRAVKRDTILEAFGYPKPMLGITEDVNRANAEAAEYVFSKWLITERLDRWRDWLNYQLLPLYGPTGEGLEFDYDSPVSENSDAQNAAVTARSTALVAMAGAGFDVTETETWLDVPEIPFTKPEPPPMIAPPGVDPKKPGLPDQGEKKTPPNADPKKQDDGQKVGGS
jgi:HK97 family phage portal protein